MTDDPTGSLVGVLTNATSVLGIAVSDGLDAWYVRADAELAADEKVPDVAAFRAAVDTLVAEGGWPRPYAMAVWYVLLTEAPNPERALRALAGLAVPQVRWLRERLAADAPDALL